MEAYVWISLLHYQLYVAPHATAMAEASVPRSSIPPSRRQGTVQQQWVEFASLQFPVLWLNMGNSGAHDHLHLHFPQLRGAGFKLPHIYPQFTV